MFILDHLWIIPLLPLVGSAANGLLGRRWPQALVNAFGVGSISLAFLAVLEAGREFWQLAPTRIPYGQSAFTWMVAGPFRVDFSFQVDQLTVVMMLVVSLVGLLIHIYSSGYMAHEGGYSRFFSFMNLFMFFMLTLVLAANFVVMFVGWEGVGLCSYLLIGFFFRRKSAGDAGKKAFITTRLGDVGFMLGILLVFWTFRSMDFSTVFGAAKSMPVESAGAGVLTWICLLLLAGAVGKSAQIPLYVWLPDAMEGPTPVSALIHAATMVTAGVYMVARTNVLYSRAPMAMTAVAVIGAATALYAATIGLVQNDIKKVLAYSTISQLGYMFLGCGVGAYAAGIFHLMTHAFFKGLLFLAAGSVIHALGGEQDMQKMGGLRGKIPVTFWTMLMATLAIAGLPPFAGFFSKDEILAEAYSGPYHNHALWLIGTLGALLTAFYMFRLVFLTFFGAPHFNEKKVHVHESPKNMLAPLVILAILSLVGGWFAAPALLWGGANQFQNFLAPVFEDSARLARSLGEAMPQENGQKLELQLAGIAVGIAFVGFFAAWWFYMHRRRTPERLAEDLSGAYRVLLNKYYIDELYNFLIVRPLLLLSTHVFWRFVDEGVIDGAVNGVAHVAQEAGGRVREVQSGNARSYAAWVVVGAVGFTVLLIWQMAR